MIVHRTPKPWDELSQPALCDALAGVFYRTTADRFVDCPACLAIIEENRKIEQAEAALSRRSEADVEDHFRRVVSEAFKK